MRRGLLLTVVLTLAVCALATGQSAQAVSLEQYRAHVPIVLGPVGQGSGYYVRDHVQTVAHVVGTAPSVMVAGVHGRVLCADVLTDSATVLPLIAGPSLPFASWEPVPGERVTIAGWRGGVYREVVTVVVGYSARTEVEDHLGVIHVVGPVLHMLSDGTNLGGMSGGPILNRHGQVVATFFAWGVFETYAVPIDGAACRLK